MDLYYMKQEALDFFKENLDEFYINYYKDDNPKWVVDLYMKELGEEPFIKFKTIENFELFPINNSKSKIEFENCKILYKNINFLNETEASDEKIWAGLCHSVFYSYVRNRWEDYNKVEIEEKNKAIGKIKSRFFFSGGIRAGIYRNTLSKCWWVGRNTYEDNFEKLDIIGSDDISTKINEIFYSNKFSSNPIILNGIIEGIKYFNDKEIKLDTKLHIRPTLQLLNVIGGGIVLDYLEKEEIAKIFIDNIKSIIEKKAQNIAVNNVIDEEDI